MSGNMPYGFVGLAHARIRPLFSESVGKYLLILHTATALATADLKTICLIIILKTMKKSNESEKNGSVENSPFIDLTYDYGFKIVMADPDHTEFLLGLLNAIIPEREIVSLTILILRYCRRRRTAGG